MAMVRLPDTARENAADALAAAGVVTYLLAFFATVLAALGKLSP